MTLSLQSFGIRARTESRSAGGPWLPSGCSSDGRMATGANSPARTVPTSSRPAPWLVGPGKKSFIISLTSCPQDVTLRHMGGFVFRALSLRATLSYLYC